eukprot:c22716_g2_i1 orf=361-981(-)
MKTLWQRFFRSIHNPRHDSVRCLLYRLSGGFTIAPDFYYQIPGRSAETFAVTVLPRRGFYGTGTPALLSVTNRSFASITNENSDGPVEMNYTSLLGDKEYHKLADETLDHLQEKIEGIGEELELDGFDTDHAEGVLTVRLGSLGTYVINKQTPNRQIWLSSPVSGPARFDWDEKMKCWIYRRTKSELLTQLQKELSELLHTSVALV